MSEDGNSNRVPWKESETDASARHGANTENSEKMMKQNANYATPPELQRNEAAARGKPVAERMTKNSSHGSDKSDVHEEDDPCLKKHREQRKVDEGGKKTGHTFRATPGPDPRFQQQNQTLRCYVMYTDFYRCEKLLGPGHEACKWFRDVFTSICPVDWVSHWDELREEDRFPWRDVRSKKDLPGDH